MRNNAAINFQALCSDSWKVITLSRDKSFAVAPEYKVPYLYLLHTALKGSLNLIYQTKKTPCWELFLSQLYPYEVFTWALFELQPKIRQTLLISPTA